jgi:N-acetylneuraminic acid mutarotase
MENFMDWMGMFVCDSIFEKRERVPARDMLMEVLHRFCRLSMKGQILVIGFPLGHAIGNGICLVDPITRTRRQFRLKMPISTHWNEGAVMKDGSVIVTCGSNGQLSDKCFIVPAWPDDADATVMTTVMKTIRIHHAVCVLDDGRVMVSGGHSGIGEHNALDTIEFMDPVTKEWTLADRRLPGTMWAHCATVLEDGDVLLSGGNYNNENCSDKCFLYNPKTDTISATCSLFDGREFHSCVRLPNGHVLATGGYRIQQATWHQQTYMSSWSELYNAGKWTSMPNPLNRARGAHTSGIAGNCLYVIGGTGSGIHNNPGMEVMTLPKEKEHVLYRLCEKANGWKVIAERETNDCKCIVAL